jgi:hypothetical protein
MKLKAESGDQSLTSLSLLGRGWGEGGKAEAMNDLGHWKSSLMTTHPNAFPKGEGTPKLIARAGRGCLVRSERARREQDVIS